MSQLPSLQHLHFKLAGRGVSEAVSLTGDMLLNMPQLTSFMLGGMAATIPAAVQHLQQLQQALST